LVAENADKARTSCLASLAQQSYSVAGPCLAAGNRAWCARERRKHSRQSLAVPRKLYLPSQRNLRCCLRPYSLPGLTPGKIRHALLQSPAELSPENVAAAAG